MLLAAAMTAAPAAAEPGFRPVDDDLSAAGSSLRIAAAAASRGEPGSREALAKGKFLIASETLSDPNFTQTVVLLLEYDATGAVGLVINRPTAVSLATLLPEEKDLKAEEAPVFLGGPVGRAQLFLLVRSTGQPLQSEQIVADVYASTSLQTLREIVSERTSVAAFQAYAGYAGWGPGQLDAELTRGDWLVAPADSETVFDKAKDTIWQDLIRKNRGLWVRRAGEDALWSSPPPGSYRFAVRHASIVLAAGFEGLDVPALSDSQLEAYGLTADGTVLDVLRGTP